MNHIARNHPGCEPKFKRVTPKGVAILDDKTTLHNASLIPINDLQSQEGSLQLPVLPPPTTF